MWIASDDELDCVPCAWVPPRRDIRMTWCDAEVVGTRNAESGRNEYRMHYIGWKKNWDEWVARDSGRIRLSSGSKQPSPAKTPTGKSGSSWPEGSSTGGGEEEAEAMVRLLGFTTFPILRDKHSLSSPNLNTSR